MRIRAYILFKLKKFNFIKFEIKYVYYMCLLQNVMKEVIMLVKLDDFTD